MTTNKGKDNKKVDANINPSDDERRQLGLDLVGKLFQGVEVNGQSMPPALGDFSLRHLFGDVWQGDDLAIEQRSLITCTILVALNRTEEQRAHFIGAKNLGIDRKLIEAMISHSAYYAGWPCAVSAGRVLNEVWQENQ